MRPPRRSDKDELQIMCRCVDVAHEIVHRHHPPISPWEDPTRRCNFFCTPPSLVDVSQREVWRGSYGLTPQSPFSPLRTYWHLQLLVGSINFLFGRSWPGDSRRRRHSPHRLFLQIPPPSLPSPLPTGPVWAIISGVHNLGEVRFLWAQQDFLGFPPNPVSPMPPGPWDPSEVVVGGGPSLLPEERSRPGGMLSIRANRDNLHFDIVTSLYPPPRLGQTWEVFFTLLNGVGEDAVPVVWF